MNQAGREEKVELKLPAGIQYEQRRDTSISAMLLSGEVDAAISARVPDAFEKGGGNIVRLYPDYRSEEARYHAATGIFPIMHVIAMRRAVFDRYPWVAMNLFKAFDEAKQRSLDRVRDLTASPIPVPWSAAISSEWGKTSAMTRFRTDSRKTVRRWKRSAVLPTRRGHGKTTCAG